MRTVLLLMVLSFALGVAGGTKRVLAGQNKDQCWGHGCDNWDGSPTGCLVTPHCAMQETCPDQSNNCTLISGWCRYDTCKQCQIQSPTYAQYWLCEGQDACQDYSITLCLGLC